MNDAFAELESLIEVLCDGNKLDKEQAKRVREIKNLWRKTSCEDFGASCAPQECRFSRPHDRLAYHGIPNVFELIDLMCFQHINDRLPEAKAAIDPYFLPRRPGSFNP